jgi:hypothetical protein
MIKRYLTVLAIMAFVLAFSGIFAASAQTGLTFFVTDVDASGFPAVQFNLRAVDLGNKVIGGINSTDLSVYENGKQVSDLNLTPNTDGPITYIIMIDLGSASNYSSFGVNNMRQAISMLVSTGTFQDSKDTVMVMARKNIDSDQTLTLLPATQSGADLTTWAAGFAFDRSTGGNTKGLVGVDDAITQMKTLVPVSGRQTAEILFFTRYIENPSGIVAPTSAQNTAANASKINTSIYVFQTDPSQYRSDALQVLAQASGGMYTALNRNSFQVAMTTAYQAINAQRTLYQVSYRSASSDAGQRTITVNSPGPPNQGAVGTYEVALKPPTVEITNPVASSTILREATLTQQEGTPVYNNDRVTVTADVSWPDGYARYLASAQLYVNGNLEDTLQVTTDQTGLNFSWDLSGLTTPGMNSVPLRVSVKDELGMTADGESTVNIEVSPPPTPSGGISAPVVAAIGLPLLCLLALFAVAVIVGGYFLLRKRSGAAGEAGGEAEAVAQKTMFAGDVPSLALATLTVMEGPSGMIGERLKITTLKVAIGRDPTVSDISFYADTASSVSRLHCTIKLDDDSVFRLTDKNSTAGTRLNGRRIQAEAPVALGDGDEIVLGDLAQKGVKLQFNFATSEESKSPYSGTADDRTHLIND